MAADQAEAALDAGVDEVLACSLTPFATRLADLPPMVLDAAVELPVHGDHFGGRPAKFDISRGADPVVPADLDLAPDDRVITELGFAEGLPELLGVLQRGAAAVLLASGDRESARINESATAWLDEAGLHKTAP